MYEIHTLTSADFETDVIIFGHGAKPFVMLPGLSVRPITEYAEAISGAYDMFSRDYTVYVFDIKKDIPEYYTVNAMADDTVRAMDMLDIGNAYMIGASQGGMIAQLIAVNYPEKVKKLLLASTCSRQNATSRTVLSAWVKLAKAGDAAALNRYAFKRFYSDEFLQANAEALRALEAVGTRDDLKRVAVLADADSRFDIYDQLCRIKCPVLVIGDNADRVLAPEASVEIAEKLKCELYMYDGYGHTVYDLAPDYKERIMRFFDGGHDTLQKV